MSQRRFVGLYIGLILLAGCGGGGGGSNGGGGGGGGGTIPTPTPTPSPTPGSDRPGFSGINAAYTGSMTQTITNNFIGTTPSPGPVTQTTASTVATTITTTLNGSGNTVFTSHETDTAPLQTVSVNGVTVVAYQPSGSSTNVRALNSLFTDSGGVSYSTTYGSGNGLLTVLPETSGTFGPNNAAESYQETDPGIQSLTSANAITNVSVDREVNADGSYTQNNGALTENSAVVNNVGVGNADFSGTYTINSLPAERLYSFSAPAAGTITYTYKNYAASPPTLTPTTVPDWIPTSLVKPSVETDTIVTGQPVDSTCHVASAYAGTANIVTQSITTADPALGTLETRTTTSYDQPGPGTVCIIALDSIATFYDYTQQEGPTRLFPSNSATVPVTLVSVAETVALQSFTVSNSARRVSSVSTSHGLLLPHAVVTAHVQHIVHQEAERRLRAFLLRGSSK